MVRRLVLLDDHAWVGLQCVTEPWAVPAVPNGDNDDDSDFSMVAPSGAWIRGFTTIGAKNGTLSSPGPYGAGDNVCIFGGWAFTGTAFSG